MRYVALIYKEIFYLNEQTTVMTRYSRLHNWVGNFKRVITNTFSGKMLYISEEILNLLSVLYNMLIGVTIVYRETDTKVLT